VRCESTFYQGLDWTLRAIRVGALAMVAKNFIYSKQTVQDMVDLQKNNIVDVLSPQAKEWIKNVLLEQGLTQEQVNNVTLISGFQENNMEHLAAVAVGTNCIYLTINHEYADMLNLLVGKDERINVLLKKDILTDDEKEELEYLSDTEDREIEFKLMRFLVGHESIHIKKYYDSGFSISKGHHMLVSGAGMFASWGMYELLHSYDFSRISSTLLSLIPIYCASWYVINSFLKEERECDLSASQNPEILKFGAFFLKALKPHTIAYVNNYTRGVLNNYQLDTMYYENKYLFAVLTKHPHPEDRFSYLCARAEELEAAQLSAQAA
jgi:hypothetical protein